MSIVLTDIDFMTVDELEAVELRIRDRHQLDHPAGRVAREARGEIELGPAQEIGAQVIEQVVAKGIPEVWLNPGADSDELIEKTRALGIKPVVACSIVSLGLNPYRM